MSHCAINEKGDEWTAYAFHDHFIATGEEFYRFKCPYCEVLVHAREIYVAATTLREPHFFVRKPRVHTGKKCPWSPAYVGYPIYKSKKMGKFINNGISLPGKLIPRRTSRIQTKTDGVVEDVLDFEKTKGHRSIPKDRLQSVDIVHTTCLVENLVQKRKAALDHYKATKEAGASDDPFKYALSCLEKHPLALPDRKGLNYRSAFVSVNKYFNKLHSIFYGQFKVSKINGGFELHPKAVPTKVQSEGADLKILLLFGECNAISPNEKN